MVFSANKSPEELAHQIFLYTRARKTISYEDRLYTVPGAMVRGSVTKGIRPRDIILYGLSCKELMDKDNFDRFIDWLKREVFPTMRP